MGFSHGCHITAVMSDGFKLHAKGATALQASSMIVDAIKDYRDAIKPWGADVRLPFPVCVSTRGIAPSNAFADLLTVYQLAMAPELADGPAGQDRASGQALPGGLSL